MTDILDKVSDVITNTANSISDKAKEVSEITALKGKIRSSKKVVENTYAEIGRQYYDAHKEDEGNYYVVQMNTITDALKKIEELEADIARLKEH